jgi:uncharacterized repeat protein (TIGR04138 family)
MQSLNFQEVLEQIILADPRYHREAYLFLREALDLTQKRIAAAARKEARHITGQELLVGLREYALGEYGPMAKTVLNEWGVRSCDDFGAIVFKMVDHGLLSKTETDSQADFTPGFDFDEAFCRPFRPTKPLSVAAPSSRKAASS